MVISNLNTKLLEDRLGFINEAAIRLKRLSTFSLDEFLRDDTPAIAESYLRRCLEAVFDIGRHITAKLGGKASVEYKEIARALADKGVISQDCAQTLMLMAGYRNRLVHFYHEVSNQELYKIVRENVVDIETFAKEIKEFISSYRQR